MYLFWLIQQKAAVNRQGFGFWFVNSPGKLSETCAANEPRRLCLGCCTFKRCSLQTQACSGGEKWSPRWHRRGNGNPVRLHRPLKLLFIFPHKLFTLYSYFYVFSLPVYRAQHSESWAKEPGFLRCLTLAFNHLSRLFGDLFLFTFLWELSYM